MEHAQSVRSWASTKPKQVFTKLAELKNCSIMNQVSFCFEPIICLVNEAKTIYLDNQIKRSVIEAKPIYLHTRTICSVIEVVTDSITEQIIQLSRQLVFGYRGNWNKLNLPR